MSISGVFYYESSGNFFPVSVPMLGPSGEQSATAGIHVRIKRDKSVDVIASSRWERTTLKLLIAYME